MARSSGPCRDQRGLSGSVQVTLLLPLAMLVLLATLQWSLLLWAESTAMAAAQDSGRRRPGRLHRGRPGSRETGHLQHGHQRCHGEG